MEGEAENLDVEVDGVAGEVAFGPAPVAVVDDEAGIGGHNKVARLAFDELVSALLEEWNQGARRAARIWPSDQVFADGHLCRLSGLYQFSVKVGGIH